jgi:hypothetical protein
MVVSFFKLTQLSTRRHQSCLVYVLTIKLTLFTVLTIKLKLFTVLTIERTLFTVLLIERALFTVLTIEHTLFTVWTYQTYVVYGIDTSSLHRLQYETLKLICLAYGMDQSS